MSGQHKVFLLSNHYLKHWNLEFQSQIEGKTSRGKIIIIFIIIIIMLYLPMQTSPSPSKSWWHLQDLKLGWLKSMEQFAFEWHPPLFTRQVSIAEKKNQELCTTSWKQISFPVWVEVKKGTQTQELMIYFKVMLGLFEPLTCAVSSISCVTSITITCPIARRTTASAIKTDGNDE